MAGISSIALATETTAYYFLHREWQRQLFARLEETSRSAELTQLLKRLRQEYTKTWSHTEMIAMIVSQPYTALRDPILTHPSFVEDLIPFFSSSPSLPAPRYARAADGVLQLHTGALNA